MTAVRIIPQRLEKSRSATAAALAPPHYLKTIQSGEILNSSTSEDTSRKSSSIETCSSLMRRTHVVEDAEDEDPIEVTVESKFQQQHGPIDIDDFIPNDSYWAQPDHEIVLDETELCRGLAGYVEGFEPEIITNLNVGKWNEHVMEDDDDDEFDYFSKYRSGSRSTFTGSNNNNKHSSAATASSRREEYSLPASAAEV